MEAIKKKSLKMNLKRIGIGDAWVNPKVSTAAQIPFLYYMGAIDRSIYIRTSIIAKKLVRSLENQDMSTANLLQSRLLNILNEDQLINFNNVYGDSPYPALEELSDKINMYIKPTLDSVNQTSVWEYFSIIAHGSITEDFNRPLTLFCMFIYFNRLLCN